MKPCYEEPKHTIYCGHALDVLREFPDDFVDMVITSPPYWGLRTYKTEPIIWGDNHCEHAFGELIENPLNHKNPNRGPTSCVGAPTRLANETIRTDRPGGNFCLKCNAWRGELGLEPTIELYIQHLILIFNEAKRVLKKTGTCFVNIDDSYNSAASNQSGNLGNADALAEIGHRTPLNKSLPAKSLCLIPQRFAIAMVENGWILRNDIVWNKPNPMPESVKDRFTTSWEHLFFFSKSKHYFFEQQFEPMTYPDRVFNPDTNHHAMSELRQEGNRTTGGLHDGRTQYGNPELGRQKRDVWEIGTVPSPKHDGIRNFATFPEKLCETPILAGCPSMICKKCGKAREKVYTTYLLKQGHQSDKNALITALRSIENLGRGNDRVALRQISRAGDPQHIDKGYTDCGCNARFESGIVLDPFTGSGTAQAVAKRLGRKSIGIELNPNYCKLAAKRLQEIPMAMELTV